MPPRVLLDLLQWAQLCWRTRWLVNETLLILACLDGVIEGFRDFFRRLGRNKLTLVTNKPVL